MCVCVFFVCIFSSKLIRTEEMHLFFFAFSEGEKKRRKKVLSHKKTTRESTYLFSIHAHKTHTLSERTAAFAAF
jgi:hypothetical protein